MRLFSRLLLSLCLLAPLLPAQANDVADLQATLAGMRAMQGNFSQTVTARSGKVQVSQGDFAILRPGKFRWHYSKPYEQLLVGDGKEVWLYDPDLEQVTVRSMDNALDASPAALLSGENNLDKRYTMKALPARDGLAWVEASPKQSESSFNRVRLGFANNEIRKMELEDSFGQTTRIEFRNITLNGKPEAGLFRFTPPKGADVIRQ